jgi:hypothetical protein
VWVWNFARRGAAKPLCFGIDFGVPARVPIFSLTYGISGEAMMPHSIRMEMHPSPDIGYNCLIFQEVTVGMMADDGALDSGRYVDTGAAEVIRGIIVSAHVKIGDNAAVICDVPEEAERIRLQARKIVRSRSGVAACMIVADSLLPPARGCGKFSGSRPRNAGRRKSPLRLNPDCRGSHPHTSAKP